VRTDQKGHAMHEVMCSRPRLPIPYHTTHILLTKKISFCRIWEGKINFVSLPMDVVNGGN